MKRALFLSAVLTVVVSGLLFAEDSKTIKGEVIDISCYTAAMAKGQDHKTCALACLEAGEPAGILEEGTNKVYTVITTDHTNPAKKIMPFVAKTVEATGTVYERSGITTIEIKEIKEASQAAGGKDKGMY